MIGESRARQAVLIVDDDEELRALTADSLARADFRVIAAADGEEMYRALDEQAVDLIVLDVNLPGRDGLSLCRELSSQRDIPIILLTARSSAIDRVVGLEMGADDYVAKPFEPRELEARIRAVLRRTQGGRRGEPVAWAREAQFGGWVLHLKERYLTAPDGCVVMLSGAEFRLLELFISSPNVVLSRDVLTATETHRAERTGRSIDNQVSRLRQKLSGQDPSSLEPIRTVRGAGYVLASEVVFR